MPNLYITEQGALVNKEGGTIKVTKDGERLIERTLKDVHTLVLFGSVQVTTQAMLALLEEGCDIAMMTGRGHFRGRVVAASGKNSILRVKQYEHFADAERALRLSKAYVQAKIENSKSLLQAYHYNTNNSFREERLYLFDDYKAKAAQTVTLDELRGYEGTAAAFYWECLGRCLTCGLAFKKRIFHPSPDPVNALLSFGYSFVARELQAILEACGLDPYVGFFHQVDYGRASLSLDLMEEFRAPLVDRLVLRLFNKGILTTDDFETDAQAAQSYLKKESLKTFISHYEEWVDAGNVTYGEQREISWRKAFWRQAESLRQSILGGTPYQPFTARELKIEE